MALLTGLLKFEGSIGDLSVYKSQFGHIVRRKGGFAKAGLQKANRYERCRENAKEFGGCSKAAAMLKRSLYPLLKGSSDGLVISRLTKVMGQVKMLDSISARGKRIVDNGFRTEEGKQLLTGFDFNINAPLKRILKKDCIVDIVNGTININGLKTKLHFNYLKEADFVCLKGAWIRAAFREGKIEMLETQEEILPLDNKLKDVVLKINEQPKGKGSDIFVLKISFMQEKNRLRYILKNEKFNVAGVVGCF